MSPSTISDGWNLDLHFTEGPPVATKTIVELLDDVDGSMADESVQFSVDGVVYEIDLSKANAEKLRAGLEPFRAASRRTGGRAVKAHTFPSPPQTSTSGEFTKADRRSMRLWANRNGITVGKIGRIPRSVELAWIAEGRPAT